MEHCWKCDLKKRRCPLCGRCDECHDTSLACPGVDLLLDLSAELQMIEIIDKAALTPERMRGVTIWGPKRPPPGWYARDALKRFEPILARVKKIQEEQGG